MNNQQSVFPVALILKGKSCLVLGGGKVATRKVKQLTEAEAMVTVIAPLISNELQQLVDAGTICWIPHPFEPADLDGMFLVYAATNNRVANRAALNLCRQRGILCCPVDEAWVDGDFITPATVHTGDLTIAINTAGHACRRSRLIKQSISRHIFFANKADLFVVGTSHEQIDIAPREALQRLGTRLEVCGQMLFRVWGIHEFYILSTCNRIEVHAVGVPDPECRALLLRILEFDRLSPDQYYIKTGWDAFEHSCLLGAGLFSQTPCEYHIVAQIKGALKTALAQKWAGNMMREWTDAVLHISADMRTAFDTQTHGGEIEDTALDVLQRTAPAAVEGTRLLVLGTGHVGSSVLARAAARFPFRSIEWFWHRTPPPLPVATTIPITLYPLSQLEDRLPGASVIITALRTEHPLLSAASLQAASSTDADPLIIIDLGVPRNVDPDIRTALLQRIRLLDLDDLKRWSRFNVADIAPLQAKCRQRVLEHKAYYDKLTASFQGRNPHQ